MGDPKAWRKCSPDKIVVHTLHAMLVDLSTFAPNDVSLGVNPAKMVPAAGRGESTNRFVDKENCVFAR